MMKGHMMEEFAPRSEWVITGSSHGIDCHTCEWSVEEAITAAKRGQTDTCTFTIKSRSTTHQATVARKGPTMKTADLSTWKITTTHGADCEDCRWSVRKAEDRIESGHALENTFNLVIKHFGHDALAVRNRS